METEYSLELRLDEIYEAQRMVGKMISMYEHVQLTYDDMELLNVEELLPESTFQKLNVSINQLSDALNGIRDELIKSENKVEQSLKEFRDY